jgi:hypothetical protein
LSETVSAPRGSEQDFPAANIVIDKFQKLTAHIPREQAARITDLVMNLEQVADASELAQALAA